MIKLHSGGLARHNVGDAVSAWVLRLHVGVGVAVQRLGVHGLGFGHAVHHAVDVEVLLHLAVRQLVEARCPAECHIILVIFGIALLRGLCAEHNLVGVELRTVEWIVARVWAVVVTVVPLDESEVGNEHVEVRHRLARIARACAHGHPVPSVDWHRCALVVHLKQLAVVHPLVEIVWSCAGPVNGCGAVFFKHLVEWCLAYAHACACALAHHKEAVVGAAHVIHHTGVVG